jgi:hypothetical protein
VGDYLFIVANDVESNAYHLEENMLKVIMYPNLGGVFCVKGKRISQPPN